MYHNSVILALLSICSALCLYYLFSLLPTDYDSIFGQAISSDDLCDVLQHVRADAKIVVVLDCCEADDIAKQIMENEQLARCAAPVYVAFTCSGSEGAIYHAQVTKTIIVVRSAWYMGSVALKPHVICSWQLL